MDDMDAGAWCAGVAFALVFPFLDKARRNQKARQVRSDKDRERTGMRRRPSIRSLDALTHDEARAYIEYASGDELEAAFLLATDRNRLDGAPSDGIEPDDAEVHHALFLLCRARGSTAPSFDEMRVELRRRVAAA
jgi:hypothetical protein